MRVLTDLGSIDQTDMGLNPDSITSGLRTLGRLLSLNLSFLTCSVVTGEMEKSIRELNGSEKKIE